MEGLQDIRFSITVGRGGSILFFGGFSEVLSKMIGPGNLSIVFGDQRSQLGLTLIDELLQVLVA